MCDIKINSINWMRDHIGEGYGYCHLFFIVLGDKVDPGMDDDYSKDNRRKICSELGAMGYYRNNYDIAPTVSDYQTLPWNLRNPDASEFMGLLEKS